jgi:hypothetical protein
MPGWHLVEYDDIGEVRLRTYIFTLLITGSGSSLSQATHREEITALSPHQAISNARQLISDAPSWDSATKATLVDEDGEIVWSRDLLTGHEMKLI